MLLTAARGALGAGFLQQAAPAPGHDEYWDGEDPGYWREPVLRQDAFVLTELEHSDDEHNAGRSAFGYHRCDREGPESRSSGRQD